ncbi:MAG: hypothetical protein PHP42_03365, partial [Bacteroidota bacterium]|nr:hypothetical protein [Bacteroidota bacterium]
GLSTIGFSLYRESVGTIAVSDTLVGSVVAGAGINFNHVVIDRYGSELNVGFDLGMIIALSENIFLGASLLNFNRPTIGSADDEIPQQVISGISYQLPYHAFVSFDLVKDVRYPLSYRTAVQFSPHEIITVRAGVAQEPSRLFGGISVHLNSIQLDYGIGSHAELGLTHSIGISFYP